MSKKHKAYHEERDSPFFRLQSKSKLADLLFIGQQKLKSLAREKELYYKFKKEKKSGGYRDISAPRDDLKAVQSRIADLLQRLAPPDFLFAPVAGRSYVDNAAMHIGANSVHLLDILDFFPSCSGNKVVWFFRQRMQCSLDVSVVLKNLVTQNDALPQGSPCSPILAYLCYVDMWEEIEKSVTARNCILSVYADDLTISGDTVPGELVWQIKKTLRKYGHQYNNNKESSKHLKPVEITGVILTPNGLSVPNRQLKKLHEVKSAISLARAKSEIDSLTLRLRGRESQIRQITQRNGA